MENNCIRDIDISILEIVKIKRLNKTININKSKDCYAISCRISGETSFEYETTQTTLKKNDVLFIPPSSKYMSSCDSEEIIAFHLKINGHVPKTIQISRANKKFDYSSLFLSAYNLWEKKEKNFYFLCMSELYKILGYTNILTPPVSDRIDRLKPALEYINSHVFYENFSLEKACQKSAMCRTHFNTLFKKKFNETPVKYINKLRVERAKTLLKGGMMKHHEIANLCGFRDEKYFYTVFNQYTGITPRKYANRDANFDASSLTDEKM